jgi:hypothetical protein
MSLQNDLTKCSRTRELLFAAFFVAVAAACVFFKLTQQPGDLLVGVHSSGRSDLTSHFLRCSDMPSVLQQRFGEWSDWSPYLALGLPVHGNPQAALLYPPNWLCYAFGATQTLSWLMVAHLWLGGVGVWLLARHIGLSRVAALVGAVSATGAPYLVAHLAEGHVAQVFTIAWVPWVLLGFERFLDSSGRHWRMIPVCVALSFLAGHVQELYYLMLLLTGCVVMAAWQERRAGNSTVAKSLLLHWILAGGFSIGLACGDLIPVWLNSRQAVRSERLPLTVAGDGLTLAHLKQLLNPFALSLPEETASKYGFYWTKLFHFGIGPLLLAALAIVAQWKRPQTRRLVWMLAGAIVFAFGTATPFFGLCYRVVPVLGSFRVPTRILFLCSFFVAILAAIGTELLCGRRAKPDDAIEDSVSGDRPAATSRGGLTFGAILGVLVAAGIGYELWRHADRVLATSDPAQLRNASEVSRFLREAGAADTADPVRILASQDLYSDDESFRDGVQRVRGYEPVPQVRLAWAVDALFDLPDGQLDFAGFRDLDLATVNQSVADLLGVRFFVTGARQSDPQGWRRVTGGQLRQPVQIRGSQPEKPIEFQIFENPDAMPRAFAIGRVEECVDLETQDRIEQLEKLNPRESVQLERDVLPPGPRSGFKPARIDEYKADRVAVSVELDAPGYLVLADLYHPGWKATVDGESVQILPADLALRAVPLNAGRHVVEFAYECPGQTVGLTVTVAALILLLISMAIARSSSSPG